MRPAPVPASPGPGYRDVWVTASDGLTLYARDYGPPAGEALPVLCLPGLTRNAADFHDLALGLSGDGRRPRRVLALDYRGRGRSGRDPDWRRYDLKVELADVLDMLTAAGVPEAVVVGTSRGGLLALALAAARPALLRGVVLNDIGPVVEREGLARIRSYVGKIPAPGSLDEGERVLARLFGDQFPGLTAAQWRAWAERTWREEEGRLVLDYDPALMRTLEGLDLDAPIPALWVLFAGLKGVPVLAIRGARSDLLSAETLAAMQAAHPGLEAVTVPDQGHAPLIEGALIDRIKAFVERVEGGSPEGAPRGAADGAAAEIEREEHGRPLQP